MERRQPPFERQFLYLGTRRFVHSTTMAEGLVDALSFWEFRPERVLRIEAFIRGLLTESGCYCLSLDADAEAMGKACASFDVAYEGKTYHVYLEGTGTPVSSSVPYDEDGLIQHVEVDTQSRCAFSGEVRTDGSLLRIVVSLTKRLHNALLSSEGYTRWYVARFDLDWPLMSRKNPQTVKIDLLRNLQGLQTKSRVAIDGQDAGLMYFSRKVL